MSGSIRADSSLGVLGTWTAGREPASFTRGEIGRAAARARETAFVVANDEGGVGVAFGGEATFGSHAANGSSASRLNLLGALPPLYPEWLGDRAFNEAHRVRFAYVVGEMANGIATAEMVIAAARAGMLGFFGAAGLSIERVARELDTISNALGDRNHGHDGALSYGVNLIHSPHEADLEAAVVALYLARGVTCVSASAYMDLTPMVVRYAASGLTQDGDGRVVRKNFVMAKVSRPEVARRFMEPAPTAMLEELARTGAITADEARLAARISVASDITVEADSGGHTDNQALPAVLPTVLRLRDDITRARGYVEAIRVGAAGGLGTPSSVASAFAMGAGYVMTGSVNQAAVESGLSPRGKALLAEARLGDVMMAPAADMFEMGVKVQVLKRGTLFAVRAHKLYELYKAHASLDAIPKGDRERLERDVFKGSIDDLWRATHAFFETRAPAENERAARDEKHRMALVFRAYLGQASKWAIAGDDARATDFQIWCGPAMGAFNAWAQGSFLEPLASRTVAQIGLNFLEGAAAITRAQQLRSYGVPVPDAAFAFTPRRFEDTA